jgi:hypothetical protein
MIMKRVWNQKDIKEICSICLDDSTSRWKNYMMTYNLNTNLESEAYNDDWIAISHVKDSTRSAI